MSEHKDFSEWTTFPKQMFLVPILLSDLRIHLLNFFMTIILKLRFSVSFCNSSSCVCLQFLSRVIFFPSFTSLVTVSSSFCHLWIVVYHCVSQSVFLSSVRSLCVLSFPVCAVVPKVCTCKSSVLCFTVARFWLFHYYIIICNSLQLLLFPAFGSLHVSDSMSL